MWCDYTCSPKQSEFLEIVDFYPPPNEQYISTIRFKLSKIFLQELWESLKDNVLGAGPIRQTYSTPEEFINFMMDQAKTQPTKILPGYMNHTQRTDPSYHGNSPPCKVRICKKLFLIFFVGVMQMCILSRSLWSTINSRLFM